MFLIQQGSLPTSSVTINSFTINGHASTQISAATKLRRVVEDPDVFLLCTGIYDGYFARIALQVGFDGIYMVRSNLKHSQTLQTSQ